jgi:hypothetical protein
MKFKICKFGINFVRKTVEIKQMVNCCAREKFDQIMQGQKSSKLDFNQSVKMR